MTVTRTVTTLTRTADGNAYAAKDCIANATSSPATLSIATGGRGYIVGVVIQADTVDVTPRLRLFLYNSAPTAIADNAVCTAPLAADSAKFRGYIDLPAMTSAGGAGDDSSHTQDMTLRIPIDSDTYFLLLETLDAVTFGNASVFTIQFFTERG